MLPLDSRRWLDLKTWEPRTDRLAALLRAWREAAGTAPAEAVWYQLRDYFLHQGSITDAAYAVLPHTAAELRRVPADRRLGYLSDLSEVEAARLKPYAPAMPADLSGAYADGVRTVQAIACECLAAGYSKRDFRYLLSSISNLHGHPVLGDMLFHLEGLEPGEVEQSGY